MTTKTETTTWTRYRHRKNPKIEYEVETEIRSQTFTGPSRIIPVPGRTNLKTLKCYDGFFKIRTIRNLFYKEEIHIPGFTYMPSEKFLELYERAR